jgi:outer membrane lipoprotein-sorting protein
MAQGRKISSFWRIGPRPARSLIAVLMLAGGANPALAQGGETEVAKTNPWSPPPQAHAPASASASAAAKPVSPIGGSGARWQATPQPPAAAAPLIQDRDLEVVAKVNAYFNGMTNLSGAFVQTDPDNKQKHGKFYLQRPGKVRFDYDAPSHLQIISDGAYLAIEDHDLNTTDRFPIEMTPFRLLLAETVDLTKDANILGVDQGPDAVVVTVQDKKGDSSGRIRLIFKKADMSLKEWIISDAQGLDTRTQVSNLEQNKQLAAGLFEFSKTSGVKNAN